MKKPKDIFKNNFPRNLDWKNEVDSSFEKLYNFAVDTSSLTKNWYLDKKKLKNYVAFTCRIIAIICITVSGIIPMLSEIEFPGLSIRPIYSSVFIAVAVFVLAIDKFGGLTTGWIRYMLAVQEINSCENKFRFDWEEACIKNFDKEFKLKIIYAFICEIDKIVKLETETWSREFTSIINELNSMTNGKITTNNP